MRAFAAACAGRAGPTAVPSPRVSVPQQLCNHEIAVTILVCRCGKKLRAPEATPGRVGRCPNCGAALRVPEPAATPVADEPAPPELASARAPVARSHRGPEHAVPAQDQPAAPLANLQGLETTLNTSRVRPRTKKRKSKPTLADKLEAWRGFVPQPQGPEKSLWRSLLYPFWDFKGVGFLSIFSVLWWFLTFVFFSYLNMQAHGEARGGVPLRAIIPSFIGLIVIFGYTLLYLGAVLVSSAAGEVDHPRWPEADLYEIIRGLSRWVSAAILGGGLGGVPAVLYWINCGPLDLLDWVVFLDLAVLGMGYALMGLVAALLFDDLLAANPITVCQAIWRVGLAWIRPCLVLIVALVLALGSFSLVMVFRTPILVFLILWATWAFVLYESMVVMRVLGLEYRRHSRKIGWFRESRRRRD